MLDLAKWCQRAIAFTDSLRAFPGTTKFNVGVGSPFPREYIDFLIGQCALPFPDALIKWKLAVGECHCSYSLETPAAFHQQMSLAISYPSFKNLWGGPDFIDLSDMVVMPREMREIADCFKEDGLKNDSTLWGNSIPMFREGNGDLIALFVGDADREPAVAYLCHELCGASHIISPSFEQFLIDWEELGYVGCHFLHGFCHPKTQMLDLKFREEPVRELQSMFRDIARPPRG